MRDDEIDPLTGLWNRQGLERRLRQIEQAANDLLRGRTDRWRSVVLLDIDDMKVVNDEHGTAAGDTVIVDVARRLTLCAGDRALVARVGGDEFVVLSPYETDECVGLFDVLTGDLYGGEVDGVPRVTLSAGAAALRAEAVDDSLRRADLAMFQAKGAGRNRLCVYDDGTDEYVEDRRDLLDRIQRMHAEIVRLADLSRTDPLTQLGNRRAMARHLEILERRRAATDAAVLFIDLDRFGEYDRLRGDDQGDLALRLVADELRSICRRSDLIVNGAVRSVGREAFRKGGEEFVIVAPVADEADALRLAERVRAGIEDLDLAHGAPGQPVLTATIGVAIAHGDTGLERALRDAGVVMTRLKNAGRRNCVGFVDPGDRPTDDELPHETADRHGTAPRPEAVELRLEPGSGARDDLGDPIPG
jgi:diguanylate cyclase (GGDEF)-like protein